jgi:hypothetical protein
VFAGALLLLVLLAGPVRAAAPPAAVDGRRAWFFYQGSFRQVVPGRWREVGPSGKVEYREHFRTAEYIELYQPGRQRYYRLYLWGLYEYRTGQGHYELVRNGRWAHPGTRPLDPMRNATERGHLATARERHGFPRLGEDFEVLAAATESYNCISWSVGSMSSWYWPRDAATLDVFDAVYAHYGFRRVAGLDYKLAAGQDKVVLYARRDGEGGVELTHAARQLADGSWSSKLGSLPLIRHLHPDDVAGPAYGVPYVLYVRPRPARR